MRSRTTAACIYTLLWLSTAFHAEAGWGHRKLLSLEPQKVTPPPTGGHEKNFDPDCLERHYKYATRAMRAFDFAECTESEAPTGAAAAPTMPTMNWDDFARFHMSERRAGDGSEQEPEYGQDSSSEQEGAPNSGDDGQLQPHEIHEALQKMHVTLHTNFIRKHSAFLRPRKNHATEWW